jgi:hypothetical protein
VERDTHRAATHPNRVAGGSLLCLTEQTWGPRCRAGGDARSSNDRGEVHILSPTKGTNVMKKMFSSVLALLALGLVFGRPSVAAPNRPEDVDETMTIPAGGVCAFGVEILLSGKARTIDLPGVRFIFTSPGLHATLTNLDDPSKQVTLNITGAFHQTTRQDGSVVTRSTGRSLLFDPQAGFVLAIGNFSFVFDGGGILIQPLEGRGQLIDACALIA